MLENLLKLLLSTLNTTIEGLQGQILLISFSVSSIGLIGHFLIEIDHRTPMKDPTPQINNNMEKDNFQTSLVTNTKQFHHHAPKVSNINKQVTHLHTNNQSVQHSQTFLMTLTKETITPSWIIKHNYHDLASTKAFSEFPTYGCSHMKYITKHKKKHSEDIHTI